MTEPVQATAPVPASNGAGRPPAEPFSPDNEMDFVIVGYDEISVDRISANEDNPRPSWHMTDDDPKLVGLGDAIRTWGQNNPAMVFEQLGHWRLPDRPGHFVLLQGERRWRACKIAGVDTLRCQIVRTPTSHAMEYAWLGIEEAFKEDWGTFYKLSFAYNTHRLTGIPLDHPDMVTRTGLEMNTLKMGVKVFQLEPEILNLVAEYERELYRQRLSSSGVRRSKGKLGRLAGVRTGEFSVVKAALVWDIFTTLRTNMTKVVSQYDDAELQQRIAQKVTQGTTQKELESLLGQLQDAGSHPTTGLVAKVADLLAHREKRIRGLLRETGAGEAAKLERLVRDAKRDATAAAQLTAHSLQLGTNQDRLRDAHHELTKAMLAFERLTHAIELRQRNLQGADDE